MSVKLRQKKLKDGRISLYLDIYSNGVRSYEILKLYLSGKRGNTTDNAIRVEAELRRRNAKDRLIFSPENPVIQVQKSAVCFFAFIDQSMKRRKSVSRCKAVKEQLQAFTGCQTLPIGQINKELLLEVQQYMIDKRGNLANSVNGKMKMICTLLNEAKAEGLIKANPFSDIPRHLRVQAKAPKINPLNSEDIRALMANADGIPRQVQQVFFVALFTGLRWSDVSKIEKNRVKTILIGRERRKVYTFVQRKVDQSAQQPLSKEAIHYLAERLNDERKEIKAAKEKGISPLISSYFFPKLAMLNPTTVMLICTHF
ncbi:MAG: site-specific integrase [Bacteroidetes bacterium]|nr:site-specific integrase [Bacteroidota bacterium]